MNYEKAIPFTPEERAALKPAFAKIDSAFREVEKGLAALRREPDDDIDPGGGFCGMDCGCSSFLGKGKGGGAICERPFCHHTRAAHWT